MYYVTIALFLIGACSLVIGYRKSNRNMLAASAILLLLSGSLESMVSGFVEGATDQVARTSSN